MSEPVHAHTHEHVSAHTEHHHATPTAESNNWLGSKLSRWTGHGLLTMGGEFFSSLGMLTTPVGIGLTMASGYPGYLLMTLPTFVGGAIGWQGAKNAGSGEKTAYIGIKALAPAVAFMSSGFASIWSTLSLASTALAMRHRS